MSYRESHLTGTRSFNITSTLDHAHRALSASSTGSRLHLNSELLGYACDEQMNRWPVAGFGHSLKNRLRQCRFQPAHFPIHKYDQSIVRFKNA